MALVSGVPASCSIGYSRSPRTTEQLLENIFIGRSPGDYDRLLDFSRAVTGNLFFAPSATFLESVTEDQPAVAENSVAASSGRTPSVYPVGTRQLSRYWFPIKRNQTAEVRISCGMIRMSIAAGT